MGLLDYYRQFEDMDESEANRLLRERRAGEKALALQEVPRLDLSRTEWPEYPNADIVSASVYTARGRINGYPDNHATALRRALAERHYLKSEQIVIGNGAAELMGSAAQVLLSAGDELVTPWPSYRLYPTIALRAGARPVPVDLLDGRVDPDALLAAIGDRARVLVLCNPNDPTATYLPSGEIRELLQRLPERVHVLLDEAFIQFQDVEDEDAALRLVNEFPRLLVFRTFSKAYGLSGLRAGYVVGSTEASPLLHTLAPVLGVNALTQAAVAQALKIAGPEMARRRTMVIEQRRKLAEALPLVKAEAPESQTNFVWIKSHAVAGAELADHLERLRILVARGGPLGDDDHIRAAITSPEAVERLIWSLGQAAGVPGAASGDGRGAASESAATGAP
jgi:histidinol-phosphate aminotransferase